MVGKYQKLFWKKKWHKKWYSLGTDWKDFKCQVPKKLKCDFYTIIVVHKEKQYEP